MSFEGFYQVRCENNHYQEINCYDFSRSAGCNICGSKTESNLVDQTNGDSEGFDCKFSDGCDVLIQVWRSEINSVATQNHIMKDALNKIAYHSYGRPTEMMNVARKALEKTKELTYVV